MKIDLKVPNSLEDISVNQYQEFVKVQKNTNDHEFLAQKMISIFCEIPLTEVLKIKYSSVVELANHFTELFKEETPLKTRFEFNGIEFGFIPQLDEISFGEYIDLEQHLQDWDSYHKALSVLYRPINSSIAGKYTIRDYEIDENHQELMKCIPVSVALGATLFFCRLGRELSVLTLDSLAREQKETKKTLPLEQSSQRSGHGIKAYTQLLKETSQNLMRLQDSEFMNALPTFHLRERKTR